MPRSAGKISAISKPHVVGARIAFGAVLALGAVSLAFVPSCASGPYPTTRATDARSSDPWIEGEPCAPGSEDAALRFEEVTAGSGKAAEMGDTVRAHYVAALPSGTVLHDSRASGPPLEVILGSTKTICGFEKGIIGMRGGAQRRVFVPWRLAFGEAGRAPDIQPRADLVITIDAYFPSEISTDRGSGPVNPTKGGGGRGGRGR